MLTSCATVAWVVMKRCVVGVCFRGMGDMGSGAGGAGAGQEISPCNCLLCLSASVCVACLPVRACGVSTIGRAVPCLGAELAHCPSHDP